MNNTDTLAINGTLQRNAAPDSHASLPVRILNVLYKWQDSGKKNLGHAETSFKDISPTRGDGQTNYAKPIWQR